MLNLKHALESWGLLEFPERVKREIASLSSIELPLQKGLRHGSVALDDQLEVMVLGSEELDACIRVRAIIFFHSIIAGCSCSDDPTPTDICNEQCTVQIDIDKESGEATITLLPD